MQERISPHSNSIPKGERIVETKTCKKCSASFDITDKDLEFYKKVSPKFDFPNQQQPSPSLSQRERDKWNDKFLVPTPTLCPDCRQQRRLAFRNERKLYKRKCDATGKDIISMYSPDKPYTVYSQEYWWSDKWDALDYGRDFDFSRSFFEQFEQLFNSVPKVTLTNTYEENENSDFVNYIVNAKNSYLCFGGGMLEEVAYSSFSLRLNKCFDVYSCDSCENCYEISNCIRCLNTFFSANSENCNNSYFLDNCEGCSFCIGCKNLKNKKYYIFNKQKTKNDFDNIINDICFNIPNVKAEANKVFLKLPSKFCEIKNSEKCIGNLISNSNNCIKCFNIKDAENIKYCTDVVIGQDIFDTSYIGLNSSRVYETVNTSINTSSILFSFVVRNNARNILYSMDIHNSSNLFGCVGLKNKQYCILNKQYSKEEYNKLAPKIIEKMKQDGEWGEFFPARLSPFGYNETVAMEYFPVNPPIPNPFPQGEKGDKMFSFSLGGKDAGKADRGNYIFNRSTYQAPFPNVQKIIPAEKLPEDIKDIPDDILNWAIECEVSKKPFRIIKQELDFYRKHNLPIPRKHPDVRHEERMKLRNPRKLFDRKCDKCGKEIKSTYAPEREEIVYCEKCYEREIY